MIPPSVSVPIRIGRRYAQGKNRSLFGAVVSVFSLLGMAVGVAALIIVLSVMNGFNREIAQRFQQIVPHVRLLPASDTARDPQSFLAGHGQVIAWSRTLEGYALLAQDSHQSPVVFQGISPADEVRITALADTMLYGHPDLLAPGGYGILLGSRLARRLGVLPGDSLDLILPEMRVTPVGLYPRKKQFQVAGVFETDSQQDSGLAFVHLADAQRIMRVGEAGLGYRVRLESPDQAEGLIAALAASDLGNEWAALGWMSDHESLFQAMRMEKVTVAALLLIIVMVAAFNIVSGLVMAVADKRAEMAVLRTMGATRSTIIRVFVIQGAILGISGVAIGALVGTAVAVYLPEVVALGERLVGSRIFDPSVFYVSFLPTQWRLQDFLIVVGISVVLTLLATLVPAWRASRIQPTEALSDRH